MLLETMKDCVLSFNRGCELLLFIILTNDGSDIFVCFSPEIDVVPTVPKIDSGTTMKMSKGM
jgi:hypothetical protein